MKEFNIVTKFGKKNNNYIRGRKICYRIIKSIFAITIEYPLRFDLEGSLYYSMKSLANNRFVQFSIKSIICYIAKLPRL